jgi:hypothetical protein
MLIFKENKHGKTGNEKSLAGANTIPKDKIHLDKAKLLVIHLYDKQEKL